MRKRRSPCPGFPGAGGVGAGEWPRYAGIAAALIQESWDKRRRRKIQTVSVAEAMAAVAAAGPGQGPAEGPIVLADYADNPGGGGYGDSVDLLGGMIAAGLENAAYATLFDPEAAALYTQASEGAQVTLSLGGKVELRFQTLPLVREPGGEGLHLAPEGLGLVQRLLKGNAGDPGRAPRRLELPLAHGKPRHGLGGFLAKFGEPTCPERAAAPGVTAAPAAPRPATRPTVPKIFAVATITTIRMVTATSSSVSVNPVRGLAITVPSP